MLKYCKMMKIKMMNKKRKKEKEKKSKKSKINAVDTCRRYHFSATHPYKVSYTLQIKADIKHVKGRLIFPEPTNFVHTSRSVRQTCVAEHKSTADAQLECKITEVMKDQWLSTLCLIDNSQWLRKTTRLRLSNTKSQPFSQYDRYQVLSKLPQNKKWTSVDPFKLSKTIHIHAIVNHVDTSNINIHLLLARSIEAGVKPLSRSMDKTKRYKR